MSNLPEGVAPDSVSGQALAALEAEGHTIATDTTPTFNGEDVVETPVVESEADTPEVKPDQPVEKSEVATPDTQHPEPTTKPDREIAYVPAWKLKTAESQKAQVEKRVAELEDELKRHATNSDTKSGNEVRDELLDLAAQFPDVDPRFFQALDAKYGKPLESVRKLEAEQKKAFQEISYSSEFEKDVVPLIKAENPNVSESTLLQIKESLKSFAFTEEYGKLPLAKVFRAEKDSFRIPQEGKKSSEGARSGAVRSAEVIDFDNMTEAQFLALSDDKKLEFAKYKANKK